MSQIRTRDVLKGTIKAIDKSAVAAQRMRDTCVHVKDKAEQGYHNAENSPEEYAANHVTALFNSSSYEIGYQMDKQGRRAVKETGERISKAKTFFNQKNSLAHRSAHSIGVIKGNTLKRGAMKNKSSIKTAEKVSKTVAKAGRQSAIDAQAIAKTTQVTKATVQNAAQTARRTVQATAKAVRAIITGAKTLVSAITASGWVAVVTILLVVLLGCAVSIFGGGSRSSIYTPVSADVEAYDPVIRKYAQQYGIPEYVELIKAVMMQESGGRGNDPMQAAEGSFNKRYPHVPDGIKDPKYSVECGVQELGAALKAAKVENPLDMERIKLALQGYNYGNGYISWALKKYGGYSVDNAAEFSSKMAAKMGWSSYGDKQYVVHVLRYYPYGRTLSMGNGHHAIVKIALTQLGNKGGQPYWSWYGFHGRVEWCACFVSWCANECGYVKAGVIPKFSLCLDGADWFKAQGQWRNRHYKPMAGDIIFFDWGANGTIDHVGIVEYCEDGVVHTVEGNSGDACRQRTYAVGNSSIYGYGLPAY